MRLVRSVLSKVTAFLESLAAPRASVWANRSRHCRGMHERLEGLAPYEVEVGI